MADAPADQFEQAVTAAREEGNLSRANVVRKVKGEQPQRERSEWHHKTRHIDSNRILSTLTQELDALTAGLDLMQRDGLDPDLVAECIPSAKRSISVINSHLRRIA
jgi:GTP cyclohydrolase III